MTRSIAAFTVLLGLVASTAHADMAAVPVVTGLDNLRDTAVDAGGRHFYFIADGSHGPAVFKLTLKNGKVRELWSGAPLVSPQGIAVGDDEDDLYVADPGAPGGGALFSLDGQRPRALVTGWHPRGVEVQGQSVYFTGDDPRNGAPGLFAVAECGGPVKVVAEGAPFTTPVGVAFGPRGDAWVSDETAPGRARVVHVDRGHAAIVTADLRAGTPPGIAVTSDGRTVALSGLDENQGTALVYLIDAANLSVTTANNGISQNIGAGGLHRAANVDVFGWCGVTVGNGGQGTVFVVTFK